MTDATPGPAARRAVGPALILVVVVVAIGVGIGGGSLLARAAGSGPSASPTDVALGPTGGPTPSPTVSPSPTPQPTPSPSPTPEPTPTLVPAPLTGLLVPEASVLQHPMAAMIDDHPDARPQSGFNAADVVWQAPAEGGIPRYMMVFQSRLPASLGPIRSARQYFIEWAAELHAMYIHLGGSGQAQATLAAKGHGQLVYNADGLRFDGSDMYRVKFRFAPHNVYTDDQHLLAMAKTIGVKDGPVSPTWSFAAPIAAEARPIGTTITVNYPTETITYRYDPVSNTYRRYIGRSKTQQVDAGDNRPVAPTNVVILRIHFGPLNDGHPDKHRLEAADVGTGEAIISTNGRTVHGTWKKAAVDAPTLLFGPDGAPFSLTAGQTFVQVLALSYTYSVTPGTQVGFGIHER